MTIAELSTRLTRIEGNIGGEIEVRLAPFPSVQDQPASKIQLIVADPRRPVSPANGPWHPHVLLSV